MTARPPGPLVSLAISPGEPDRIVAAAERGLYRSDDGGENWRQLSGDSGFLAWARSGSVFLVEAGGRVSESSDDGRSWQDRGALDRPPAALEAAGNDLYAAVHDGTVQRSTDAGRSWTVRSKPQATTPPQSPRRRAALRTPCPT